MGWHRGLSPILSTMILLSAALLAGIVLYTYFSSTITGMVNTPNPVIEQATYYPQVDMLYVKVRNYGGAPVPLNESRLIIVGKGAECTCAIVCSSTSTPSGSYTIPPSGTLTLKVFVSSGTGTTSIPECNITCTGDLAACTTALQNSVGYVGLVYTYAGTEQMTQLASVTLG
ncbi:hypothetical protein Pyrfu_1295 [Pyrolobus fumarii 1A]|uniref:Archaeal Type IV pilin N-terminal domain-containing protein n=2 Tax=Pyrolobus fumarii TaxID=54252 RepID=G0EGC9_PYRF1|nr:hypothetical protein Pyrfu_1295 [Pyrolobus fumarii 1A]